MEKLIIKPKRKIKTTATKTNSKNIYYLNIFHCAIFSNSFALGLPLSVIC